jgi:hypothetical protein
MSHKAWLESRISLTGTLLHNIFFLNFVLLELYFGGMFPFLLPQTLRTPPRERRKVPWRLLNVSILEEVSRFWWQYVLFPIHAFVFMGTKGGIMPVLLEHEI